MYSYISHLRSLQYFIGVIFLALFQSGCGGSGFEDAPADYALTIDARMGRIGTNTSRNTVIVDAPSGYMYSINGEGFNSDLELNEFYPVSHEAVVYDFPMGDHSLDLNIIETDGTNVLSKKLTWGYSDEVPSEPVVSFASKATNSSQQFLLIASSRKKETTELWVEGDLIKAELPEGEWKEITSNGKVAVTLSKGEGVKSFIVKYRNIYGNESDTANVSILKKETPPKECSSEAISLVVANEQLQIQLKGKDSGSLFYKIWGDTKKAYRFKEFVNSTVAQVELTPEEGEKRITVQIRDAAENYCLKDEIFIKLDKSHKSSSLEIEGKPFWVDDINLNLNLYYEYFEGDNPEMFISGGVSEDENTFKWIPFSSKVKVYLLQSNGNRFIRAKFRNNRGEETEEKIVSTYLRPFVNFSGVSSPYGLHPSNIVGLESMTIIGCAESYSNVSYQATFSCSGNSGDNVTVQYLMPDGSIATVNGVLP